MGKDDLSPFYNQVAGLLGMTAQEVKAARADAQREVGPGRQAVRMGHQAFPSTLSELSQLVAMLVYIARKGDRGQGVREQAYYVLSQVQLGAERRAVVADFIGEDPGQAPMHVRFAGHRFRSTLFSEYHVPPTSDDRKVAAE